MEFENRGPLLKPLLLIGGASSRMGTRKELLPFPDGRLSIEHALKTLQSAVPTASTIYISLHNQSQLSAIQPALERFEEQQKIRHSCSHDEEHEHNASTAELQPIFDGQDVEIGPAGGLLAAYSADRKTKWLVLGCDYPLLPPSALQQLMLEYEDPATCFENESGFAEPLIAIWSPTALQQLQKNVAQGKNGLNSVVKQLGGKLVKPLREHWILGTNTKDEWDEAMEIVASQKTAW